MIELERPLLLLLAIPWGVFCFVFGRAQKRAVAWIDQHVSGRFRRRLTVHSQRTLTFHLVFLGCLGALLVVAAARPVVVGKALARPEGGQVLLIFDASGSMNATDVSRLDPQDGEAGEEAVKRLVVAQEAAAALIDQLAGYRFAISSFSGVTTLHLPMTDDRALARAAIAALEVHSFYRHTGSSFATALEMVFHFATRNDDNLQVVLLSDGEPPFAEAFDEPLAALAEQQIAVHTLAIGSLEGQGRLIFDFADVVAKKPAEERRVLREFTTRRVDAHLQKMSLATGGRFAVASAAAAEQLAEAIRQRLDEHEIEDDAARTDLAFLPLLAFVLGFLLDTLIIGHLGKRPGYAFDVERLGSPRKGRVATAKRSPGGVALTGLLLVLLAAFTCRDVRQLARLENERGIAADTAGERAAARLHYERSRGYRFETQIPTYNLARSVALTGDNSEAHQLFQQALASDPLLAEAHHGDGVVLYSWGQAERDPRDCQLDRTRDLWRQALRRFTTARDLAAAESPLATDAEANRAYLEEGLAALEALIAEPPDHCPPPDPPPPPPPSPSPPPSPPPPSSSAGGGGGGGGSGDADDDSSGGDSTDQSTGGGASNDSSDSNANGGGSGSGSPQENDHGEPLPPPPSPPPDEEPAPAGGSDGPSPAQPPPPAQSDVDSPLSAEELGRIAEALARIEEQKSEEGKYYRRTRPEHFRQEDWQNPDDEIWW